MAKIVGLKSLRQKLDHIPKAATVAIKAELRAIAEEMVALAKVAAPYDDGDLHDSIGWTFGSLPKGAFPLGAVKFNRSDLRVVVFAGNKTAFYARWQEFGTVKFAAQPYFFPAYRAVKGEAKRRIAAVTGKAIREAIR